MVHRYYGKVDALWRLYFVISNKELSTLCYSWMIVGMIGGEILTGLVRLDLKYFQMALGHTEGIFKGMTALLFRKELSTVLAQD